MEIWIKRKNKYLIHHYNNIEEISLKIDSIIEISKDIYLVNVHGNYKGEWLTKSQIENRKLGSDAFYNEVEPGGNYIYIVECKDGSYYTGWTNHLKKRIEAHNSKKGAKYTKSRGPVKLVYYEEFNTKIEAMQREYAIKQLTRKEKERMIYSFSVDLGKIN